MASLSSMEGFLGVDKDGAPILAPTTTNTSTILAPTINPTILVPTIRPSNPGFKSATATHHLDASEMKTGKALTVHEILETVTEPPILNRSSGGGGAEKHSRLKVLELNQADNQASLLTSRSNRPGIGSFHGKYIAMFFFFLVQKFQFEM